MNRHEEHQQYMKLKKDVIKYKFSLMIITSMLVASLFLHDIFKGINEKMETNYTNEITINKLKIINNDINFIKNIVNNNKHDNFNLIENSKNSEIKILLNADKKKLKEVVNSLTRSIKNDGIITKYEYKKFYNKINTTIINTKKELLKSEKNERKKIYTNMIN